MTASEQDLCRRYAADGDESAFAALVELHARMVLSVCRRVLGNQQDAEDVSQGVFCILAKKAGSIDASRSLAPWLYRVASDLARDALRARQARERYHHEASAMPRPAQPLDLNDDIDDAISHLPERERSAIVMFHFEGRSLADIAKLFRKPESTIGWWLQRGRDRLRDLLLRRGVAVGGVALASSLGSLTASEVPAGFVAATTKVATTFLATGAASTPATAFAAKGFQAMQATALKSVALVAGCAAALGVAGLLAVSLLHTKTSGPGAPLGSTAYMPSPERPIGWRGDGTGCYPGAEPPITWSRTRSGVGYATTGILWATPLPNGSVSSPIIVGDRIFLTAEPADLICIDKRTGRIEWIRSEPLYGELSDEKRQTAVAQLAPLLAQLPQANAEMVAALNARQASAASASFIPPPPRKRELEKQIFEMQANLEKNIRVRSWDQGVYGYSGPTPTSDGRHVYAFYANGNTVCYDLDGTRRWLSTGDGNGPLHGNFASPLLGGNRLMVWAGELRGYDADTGKLLWTNPTQIDTYGSLIRLQSGGDLVAGTASGRFTRVRDGKAIWNGPNFGGGKLTPIVVGDQFIAAADTWSYRSYRVPTTTEAGSLTPALTLTAGWTADELAGTGFARNLIASPLCVDGLLYSLTQGGWLFVNKVATGELLYRQMLPMKPRSVDWSWAGAAVSPTLAGNRIYLMDNQGTTVVIQPGPTYRQVAVNRIEESTDGSEQPQSLATPVFEGQRMYYRSSGFLYCIGADAASEHGQ